jgi:uncharacterized protein YndB with AHSA1/START domain
VGHRFTLIDETDPGHLVRCKVLEIEAPHRMVWSWKRGRLDTQVTFELHADANGTHLDVTHSGVPILASFGLGNEAKTVYGKKLPRAIEDLADRIDRARSR